VLTGCLVWVSSGMVPRLSGRPRRQRNGSAVEEIVTVSAPDPRAVTYPSVDVYARVRCPVTFVLPDCGF